jgi:hypothetical protein
MMFQIDPMIAMTRHEGKATHVPLCIFYESHMRAAITITGFIIGFIVPVHYCSGDNEQALLS